MGAMHEIAARLAKIPGRKNMIWLSTGFPPDDSISKASVTTLEKMDNSSKILGNADFPLFAIDAKGLVPYQQRIAAGGGGGGGGGGARSGVDGPTPASASYGTMSTSGRIPTLRDFDYSKSLAEFPAAAPTKTPTISPAPSAK